MIICGDRSFAAVANKAIRKLIKQGGVCTDDNGSCVYVNINGRHCPVGWLISPDNEKAMSYHGCLEGLIETKCLTFEKNREWIERNQERLMMLQEFHDGVSYKNPDLLPRRVGKLRDLGVDEKLMNEFISVCEEKTQ